jgi:phosphatidylserine/phosphatidylglycerophosphate/cardiolipin synthase-like enzyme
MLCFGCGTAPATRAGKSSPSLPLPDGIEVGFNHQSEHQYLSPLTGRWRQGNDLEAMVLRAINQANSEILVAVQELSLPSIAEALVRRHRQGVSVKVVLDNNYSTPWSEQHSVDLSPHQRQRQTQLQSLGGPDAVLLLRRAGVPMIDDTADGSNGSGLMHHKFLVADRRVVVTGSANFTASCIHGDADDTRTSGNVNHLLRFESPELAAIFAAQFAELWGDGPGGHPDSLFGLNKKGTMPQQVRVGNSSVQVLFAPHRRSDPDNGLQWLATQLQGVRSRLDISLFVFSAQNLADELAQLHARGVPIRVLADPGFANRPFSEVLDLMGIGLPDRRCRLEAGNRIWSQPLQGVGTPRLARGDKLHHKFAVLDGERVITGSFNWSPSAAYKNDETLLLIDSPLLARHFGAEMDRLWRGAELGETARLRRGRERARRSCGSGRAMQQPPSQQVPSENSKTELEEVSLEDPRTLSIHVQV